MGANEEVALLRPLRRERRLISPRVGAALLLAAAALAVVAEIALGSSGMTRPVMVSEIATTKEEDVVTPSLGDRVRGFFPEAGILFPNIIPVAPDPNAKKVRTNPRHFPASPFQRYHLPAWVQAAEGSKLALELMCHRPGAGSGETLHRVDV